MKVVLLVSAVLILFALIFPVAAAWGSTRVTDAPEDTAPPSASEPPSSAPDTVEHAPGDEGAIALLDGETVRTITVREYLIGALAAEMPASFEPEALKAQAVALRSYLLRRSLHRPSNHPETDICTNSACCAAFRDEAYLRGKWGADFDGYMAKITSAVDATADMYLSFEGEPALAVFHSSSSGRTEASGEIWSESLPYLVSVESPEDESTVPNFVSSVTLSAKEFKETVLQKYPQADFSGGISTWLGASVLDMSGRVSFVTVGGVQLTGAQLRSLFGLRSAAIEFAVGEATITMITRGYGHGVGMSQYGANVMAANGADFQEILAAYYPGTQLINE